MDTEIIALIISACLVGAVVVGSMLRPLLPAEHRSADTKETVKVAMGLLATMAALVLGLLVASAKGSYDNARNEVIQMAAKIVFMDRVLTGYGPEAGEARAMLRQAVEQTADHMRSQARNPQGNLAPNTQAGNALYLALQELGPTNETQRGLKSEAITGAMELARLRTLLVAESIPSISKPLLIVVGCWLVLIFLSFSVIAPRNATATIALMVSALSAATAIFLILELDRPFTGLLRMSNEPMLKVLTQLKQSAE
jgi:hypothetical protein